MMQTIYCENCGGDHIDLGAVSVDVILNKNRWCDTCKRSEPLKQHHFFCSEKCFQEFDKTKLIWKE